MCIVSGLICSRREISGNGALTQPRSMESAQSVEAIPSCSLYSRSHYSLCSS